MYGVLRELGKGSFISWEMGNQDIIFLGMGNENFWELGFQNFQWEMGFTRIGNWEMLILLFPEN